MSRISVKRIAIFVGLLLLATLLEVWYSRTAGEPSFAASIPSGDSSSSPPIAQSSLWNVQKEVSPIDGVKKIAVMSNLNDLVIRCLPHFEGYIVPKETGDDGETHDQVLDSDETDGNGESDSHQLVRYRLDGKVSTAEWGLSEDQSALFIPTQTLRRMISAKKIIIEYKPYEKAPETYSVSLDGLHDALVKAGCPSI